MKKALTNSLLCLALLLVLATAAGFGARFFWLFELATHFRPHLAAVALLLVFAAILLRHRTGAILAFSAVAVNALPLWAYVDLSAHASAQPLVGMERHRLLHFNLQHRYADLAGLKAMIEREAPDFVLMTEVPESAAPMIEALRESYPHVVGHAGDSLFAVVLLSRIQPSSVQVDRAVGAKYPIVAADFCRKDPKICMRLVTLHTSAPLLPYWSELRNQQLTVAASYTRDAAEGRTLLVGDLNLTPWSPYFTKLKRDGQLSDSGLGRGLVGTWQSTVPFVGLMIDHVLTGPRVVPLDRRIGPDLNSDHRPVIVDFALH